MTSRRMKQNIGEMPQRGTRTQPGISTPGHVFIKPCALKGHLIRDLLNITGELTEYSHSATLSGWIFSNKNPGLKPRVESFCPFGAVVFFRTDYFRSFAQRSDLCERHLQAQLSENPGVKFYLEAVIYLAQAANHLPSTEFFRSPAKPY